jgi:hypothetical protein
VHGGKPHAYLQASGQIARPTRRPTQMDMDMRDMDIDIRNIWVSWSSVAAFAVWSLPVAVVSCRDGAMDSEEQPTQHPRGLEHKLLLNPGCPAPPDYLQMS